MKRLSIITLMCGIWVSPAYANKVYKWIDADGSVQITQMPPPSGVKEFKHIELPDPKKLNQLEAPAPKSEFVDKNGNYNQVLADVVKKYNITKGNGSVMDICVQAGFVAAAYLHEKDESNYKKWKQIEEDDCAKAGLSRKND